MSRKIKPVFKTKLTDEYGIELPFVNAGMAFVATSRLAAAVARAGTIACAAMTPDYLREEVREIRSVTCELKTGAFRISRRIAT
jgi:enoyl-[acyl-carrier protein] reductase II